MIPIGIENEVRITHTGHTLALPTTNIKCETPKLGSLRTPTHQHTNTSPLELIRYLDDPHYDLMRVAVLVEEAEAYHGVVFTDLAFNVDHLIALKVFFKLFLEDVQGIGKIDFQWTGVVSSSLHSLLDLWLGHGCGIKNYQRIRAEAQVNPLPNAAKQIKSFSLILPSAQASLMAIGIEAAVVLP